MKEQFTQELPALKRIFFGKVVPVLAVMCVVSTSALAAPGNANGGFDTDYGSAAGNGDYFNALLNRGYLLGIGSTGLLALYMGGQTAWRKHKGDPRWEEGLLPTGVMAALVPVMLFVKGFMTNQGFTNFFGYSH